MIHPSSKIETHLRHLIDQSYADAVGQIGKAEFDYVHHQIERKLSIASKSKISWVNSLGEYMEALYSIHVDYVTGEIEIDPLADRHIGAALFYFVNPYDIIPDHTTGVGYLDDVHVLNSCLKKLNRKYPDLVKRYHPNGTQ